CSSTALVATVVPWMKRATAAGSAPANVRTRLTASATPTSRSLGVVGTLVAVRRPSAPSATMSVKVPPMSTPICMIPPCSATQRGERAIRRNAGLERFRRQLPGDAVSLVEVEGIVDPGIDARLAGLASHGEVAAAVIGEMPVEDEAHRARH